MSDLTSFNCPSCSASLNYDGRSETIRCDYCDSTIIVPDSLKSSSARQGVLGDEVPEMGNSVHDILILLQNGRKIEAIKLYRETFGVGLKEAKEAVELLEHGQPTVIHLSTIGTTAAAGAATSSGCGCGMTIFIFLITFGIIGAVFWLNSPDQAESIMQSVLSGDFESIAESVETATESVVTFRRQPFNKVVATTQGGDGLAPDLLIENWQYGGDEIPILVSYTEANSESGRHDIRWEQEAATTDENQSFNFGFDNQNVYITMKNALKAYSRADGELLWQLNLSDQVTRLCDSCIRAKDGVVVVFTDDNSLYGIDATTGQQLWQQRLDNDNYLYVDDGLFTFAFIDGNVAIVDRTEIEGSLTAVLRLHDLQTGELVHQLNPGCPDPENFFDDDTLLRNGQVFINEGTNAVYFIFGSGMVDLLCVQQWDPATGEMLWGSRLAADIELPFGLSANSGITTEASRSPYFVLLADSLLAQMDTAVSDNNIVQIDLNNGEVITQVEDEGYDMAPLGMVDNIIVASAVRTRGSDQTEIWGINRESAVPVWQHTLQEQENWSSNVTPNGIYLIQLLPDDDPMQLLTQNLSPTDGSLTYETSQEVNDIFSQWRGLTWTRDFAYLSLQSLMEIDLHDGTGTAVWP